MNLEPGLLSRGVQSVSSCRRHERRVAGKTRAFSRSKNEHEQIAISDNLWLFSTRAFGQRTILSESSVNRDEGPFAFDFMCSSFIIMAPDLAHTDLRGWTLSDLHGTGQTRPTVNYI